MTGQDISHIPRPLRRLLIAVLALLSLVSTLACVHFVLLAPNPDFALLSLSAAQAAITGLVVVSLVAFSLRMKSVDEVERLLDDFFVSDICGALSTVFEERPVMRPFLSARTFLSGLPRRRQTARLETDFARGQDAASFRITAETGETLDLYVKANVRSITVKYFLDPSEFDAAEDEREFRDTFAQLVAGAESVGYATRLFRRHHAARGGTVLELNLYLDMGLDLISDPAKRLFLRNDLRTMTRSVAHTLRSHRESRITRAG